VRPFRRRGWLALAAGLSGFQVGQLPAASAAFLRACSSVRFFKEPIAASIAPLYMGHEGGEYKRNHPRRLQELLERGGTERRSVIHFQKQRRPMHANSRPRTSWVTSSVMAGSACQAQHAAAGQVAHCQHIRMAPGDRR